MSFLDPQFTSDGKPYGPIRYKQIFDGCLYISKNTHNSVEDIKEWTPLEFKMAITYLNEHFEKEEEAFNKMAQSHQRKK